MEYNFVAQLVDVFSTVADRLAGALQLLVFVTALIAITYSLFMGYIMIEGPDAQRHRVRILTVAVSSFIAISVFANWKIFREAAEAIIADMFVMAANAAKIDFKLEKNEKNLAKMSNKILLLYGNIAGDFETGYISIAKTVSAARVLGLSEHFLAEVYKAAKALYPKDASKRAKYIKDRAIARIKAKYGTTAGEVAYYVVNFILTFISALVTALFLGGKIALFTYTLTGIVLSMLLISFIVFVAPLVFVYSMIFPDIISRLRDTMISSVMSSIVFLAFALIMFTLIPNMYDVASEDGTLPGLGTIFLVCIAVIAIAYDGPDRIVEAVQKIFGTKTDILLKVNNMIKGKK